MDKAILIGIQEYIRNDYLTPVMLFVSAIGSFGAVWLFMAMLLTFRRSSRGQGILLLIAILFSGGVGECIKHVVMRPRPFLQIPDLILLGPLPRSFSFPSGHTICAFALAFILQGFNIYAAAYFTGLNNGKISAVIALSRTFLFQTLAIFGLPLILGAESLWICQAVAELVAAAVSITLLYAHRRDYLGDKS